MESQNVEWKRQWEDKFLKQICGFANRNGGVMKIGIDDDGSVVGVKDPKSDMKITDSIANKLSIYPVVEIDESTNVITIKVEKSSVPIDYDGKFYIRTGNTTHVASGREFDLLMSKRINISWSDMPFEGMDISCLDKGAIDYFRKKALNKGSISSESLNISDGDLLSKLKLITKEGVPTRAAVLLFHSNPDELILGSSVKVGLFEGIDSPEILYQDYIGGPLIYMPDRLYDLISTKYCKKRISYEGLNMVETAPYPEGSLREAILNAVMHNNYGSGVPIQIRLWEDRIRISDKGGMPYDWNHADLMKDHDSVPVNPGIANVFFFAGFVEGWGRGIKRIMEGYIPYPDSSPIFEASHYSFTVVLRNINYRADVASTELDKDVVDILRFLDYFDGRSSREISSFLGYSSSNIVTRKIKPLIESGLVERTLPKANRSKNQKYRVTEFGRKLID